MTFLRISQNQSWIEQDYALQSFTLSWLWFKGWLIQTVELLIWTTVSIVTADNNYSPLMQPTVQQSKTGIWEMSMWFLSFLKNVRPSLVVLFFFFRLLINFVSPFVLSFSAHTSSRGNLQQLEFRESKETR